ncbi:MAG: hypothetical protein KDC24_00475 [Saprospiraceae bacterium]|nr:hypothetical protein [Saprospiraceae bacterium]
MSKKKFTDGLESLFDEVAEETVTFVEASTPKGPQKVKRVRSKGSSKDFTADLDTLLEEALSSDRPEDSTIKETGTDKNNPAPKQVNPKVRKPLSGLDALIRKTIEVKMVEEPGDRKATKRVTFAVDKKKLEKLKAIARSQNAYLKDVITQIISEYIKEAEQDKAR